MTIQDFFKTSPVTFVLVASFITLYVVQVISGVDASSPSVPDLINWGANALPLTMNDEPWRLLSSAFLHIGFMHLLFNGYAIYCKAGKCRLLGCRCHCTHWLYW